MSSLHSADLRLVPSHLARLAYARGAVSDQRSIRTIALRAASSGPGRALASWHARGLATSKDLTDRERIILNRISMMGDPVGSTANRFKQAELWTEFVISWEKRHTTPPPAAPGPPHAAIPLALPPASPKPSAAAPPESPSELLREACLELLEPMILSHMSKDAPEWRESANRLLQRARDAGIFHEGETLFTLSKKVLEDAPRESTHGD